MTIDKLINAVGTRAAARLLILRSKIRNEYADEASHYLDDSPMTIAELIREPIVVNAGKQYEKLACGHYDVNAGLCVICHRVQLTFD